MTKNPERRAARNLVEVEKIMDHHSDFTRDSRILLLALMAIPIGVIGTLVAYALLWLIGGITNLSFFQRLSPELVSPAANHLGIWVVIVPVVGGLIVGAMARYGSEKIRGHGIPEALEAILIGRSRIEAKVALLKPLSSAISIGTGGPFGAEGPIIMTGGAFGSLFAQLFHLSPAERKTLLAAGAAAGMSAIFASPVAAVLIAVELLLFEWKPRSFVPVAVASAVATAARVPLMGSGPLFGVVPHAAFTAEGLLICLIVGIIAGFGSALLTVLVYGFEDFFYKLPIHWAWWPAIGGLAVGVAGYFDPRTLGVGYDVIGALLNGKMIGTALWMLLILKSLAWSISLGSGTSGGVLAPLLIMGGALGAFESHWIPIGDPGLWALIGMAAMMGGTMRVPLTAMVFTLELTHDLNLLLGLLVSCTAAYGVTVLLLRRSILTEKIARRGNHLVREYSINPLEMRRVSEVMATDAPRIPADTNVGTLVEKLGNDDPWLLTRHHAALIVDSVGRLAGVITQGDIARALRNDPSGRTRVLSAGNQSPFVTYPDELVHDAVVKMIEHDVGRLPVVARHDPRQIVGYFGRSSVLMTLIRQMENEKVRDPGWLAGFRRKPRVGTRKSSFRQTSPARKSSGDGESSKAQN
jgi:H+/Cl- antiporter ClcA/CBS domain-containing protein